MQQREGSGIVPQAIKERALAQQVAEAAGVSQSAVSRAFTPGASVSPVTRERILRAAEELGYEPRRRAAFESRATGQIAIVMADISNPFFPPVLDTLMLCLQRRGLSFRLHCAPRGVDVDTLIPELFAAPPAGILLNAATTDSRLPAICRERHMPLVLLNRILMHADVSMVACDNYAGGRQVAALLHSAGRRNIAFMAGREEIPSSGDRERGLREGLMTAGLDIVARQVGGFSYDSGVLATEKLLAGGVTFDALFCANDVMALAAIDTLRRAGRRIPEDVAIVGFDDIPMASWSSYNLTTIKQRIPTMVEEAADLMQRLMSGDGHSGISRLVPGLLIERGTTPPLRT